MTADGPSIPTETFILAWQFTASEEYDIADKSVSAEQMVETLAS
jgi:hypothetical protein